MRALPKVATALLAATTLTACSAPLPIVYPGSHAQETMPSNTMLGEACDGHDYADSIRLSGDTYLTADFKVSTISAMGAEVPYTAISSPVSKATSQMARPEFSGRSGPEACGGVAVRTVYRWENDKPYVDWVLELAPRPDDAGKLPADPWRVRGRTPLPTSGYARDEVAFHMAGQSMIARLELKPGRVWIEQQNAWRAKRLEDMHPVPRVAAPLPDERPGLTLDDVTNPAFRH
jgi:hypothetical protein